MSSLDQHIIESQLVRMHAQRADEAALTNPDALYWSDTADACAIARLMRDTIKYPVAEPIAHYRVFNHDFSRCGIVVLHNQGERDAELLVLSSPGMRWSRAAVRYLARWIFNDQGFARITLRIKSDDLRARDFARRLGFKPEGTLRRWFADDQDCILWGMLRAECPWLGRFTRIERFS